LFGVWRWTGNDAWILEFFRVPAALMMVGMATVAFRLSLRVVGHFEPGEPLRTAWSLIAVSAGCDAVAAVFVQVFGISSRLNLISHLSRSWSDAAALQWRQAGFTLGGSCRFALLAAGLGYAIRAYRRSGFLGRLAPIDRALLALIVVYIARNAVDVVRAVRAGEYPQLPEIANWPVDPLLCLLLGQAMLLYRSVRRTGGGWVGN